ncbi:MAG TPA: tetratricopeptide repeat protein [Xanthomonadaceae bacterium]|jgi:serine/threonine protein kinase/tetratricopeptide (TPR) repeat protein
MADETLNVHDTWDGARSEGPGTVIGPYTLLRRIGEGGFGDVYEAEQTEPVRRRVALKIIKLGMDTREVIARFELERRALAMMEHPHIARVLDAGATASGRPYFVMELVDGEPVTGYCDTQSLPIEARLRLFEQVCAAVQHAHTKGVIHRDLKPGNVLVSTHDGQPFAKVIDFGIAKATSGSLGERTLATQLNQVIGTPLYMSPEQAMGSADIDTRTDIYSLGVILYELLTGSTPVERAALTSVSLADTQRLICEVEPPRPSQRLLQSAVTLSGVASVRAIEPRKLARVIRGELDWIVMRALEKEPARRYQTATDFAADLRRYLAGEPVLAAPPSASYRMRKFVRRHKGSVAAGSLVALALLAGIVAFAWQARIARHQADRAQRQTVLAQQQTALALARTKDLEQVANFEAAMLGQVNPVQAGKLLSDDIHSRYAASLAKAGVPEAERVQRLAALDALWQQVNATDTARDLMDNTILKPAVAAIDKRFKGQPLVDAFLRQTLAYRYASMGLNDAALPLQESALATRRRLLGNDNPATLESMLGMAGLLAGMGKPADAEPLAREALRGMRRVLGNEHEATLRALSLVGLILYDNGRWSEAEPYYRDVLAINRRVLGEDNPITVNQMHNLGLLLMYEHKPAEAEPMLREAVSKERRMLGDEEPNTLLAMENLGFLLEREGKLDQAVSYERQALAMARHALGEEHLVTLNAASLEALALDRKGEYAEADKLLAPIEPAVRKTFVGSYSFMRATYLMRLGLAHAGLGDHVAAESELLEAEFIARQTRNVTHDEDVRDCSQALVDLYTAWNRAEPGKGHDAKAAEWQRKLDAMKGGAAGRK